MGEFALREIEQMFFSTVQFYLHRYPDTRLLGCHHTCN